MAILGKNCSKHVFGIWTGVLKYSTVLLISFLEIGILFGLFTLTSTKTFFLIVFGATLLGIGLLIIRALILWKIHKVKLDEFGDIENNLKGSQEKQKRAIAFLSEFSLLGTSFLLLLIPGLLTDLAGLLFLFPPFSILLKNHFTKKTLKELQVMEKTESETPASDESYSLLQVDLMALEIGAGLIPLVDESQGGTILERLSDIRKTFAGTTGVIVPPIRIRDNMLLNPNTYNLFIRGRLTSEYDLRPDKMMVLSKEGAHINLEGEDTTEPAFNMPAKWINAELKAKAEGMGLTIVHPETVLATHLTEIIKKHGGQLLTIKEIIERIAGFEKTNPGVTSGIIPEKISYAKVKRVFQTLLKESVSIRDQLTIFEGICELSEYTDNPVEIAKRIRKELECNEAESTDKP